MASLNLTLGALEIGSLISSALYGVTLAQIYTYHTHDFKDNIYARLLVAIIGVAETIHTCFLWAYMFDLTVTNYGNPSALGTVPWSLGGSQVLNATVGLAVQGFFAYRIFLLSKHYWITVLSWLGSGLQFSASVALTVIGHGTALPNIPPSINLLSRLILGANIGVDVLNATCLCYYLVKQRSANKRTNKLIDGLVMWTVETGLVTSLTAVLMLVLLLASPETDLWIGISVFYAKFYSNSLLASFNRRAEIRRNKPDIHTSFAAPSLQLSSSRTYQARTESTSYFPEAQSSPFVSKAAASELDQGGIMEMGDV